MTISVYENVGSYSKNVDIEYNSSDEADCAQVDKFVSRILHQDSVESMAEPGEARHSEQDKVE